MCHIFVSSLNTAWDSLVLTHCEVKEVPAAVAVLYGSTSQSGVESVNAFNPLLSSPLLRDAVHKMVSPLVHKLNFTLPSPLLCSLHQRPP